MSEYRFGPLAVDLRDPHLSWTSDPSARGIRTARISGVANRNVVHQLSVLINNPDRVRDFDEYQGVLEYCWFDWPHMASPYNGWYLLAPFTVGDVEWRWAGDGLPDLKPLPLSLSGACLGDNVRPIITRKATAKASDFTIQGRSVVVNPFWCEDPDGEQFPSRPGGAYFTREYDPTMPHDLSRATPVGGSRRMPMNGGPVLSTGDSLATVVRVDVPHSTDYDGQRIPRWLTDRGGDVRAHDRRSGDDVFGQGHSFTATTDVEVTNGLVSFWVGSRNVPPYLTVSALRNGAWRHIGYLHLGGPGTLSGARLVSLTPESATLAVAVRGAGDVFLTLRRGRRAIEVGWDYGIGRGHPDRGVRWSGLPPTTRTPSAAASAAGHYGSGLAPGSDVAYHWPANAPATSWATDFWWRPSAGATAASAGLLSIYDTAGARAASLRYDHADQRFKFTVGGTTLQSAAQAFTAGQEVAVALRFDVEEGMGISVRSPAGVVAHVRDLAAFDPGTTRPYAEMRYATNGGGVLGGGAVLGGGTTFGGVDTPAAGVIDNHRVFDGWLSDAEVQALLLGTTALGSLPSPASRLVWWAHYDARPLPAFSTRTNGVTYEATAAGGTTRNPDADGLTKALVYVDDDGDSGVSAVLATTEPFDDIADYQFEFAAEFLLPQELSVEF